MKDRWSRFIEVGGETFEVIFFRRPFREGLEARMQVRGVEISLAELGLGEQELLQRARERIEAELRATR